MIMRVRLFSLLASTFLIVGYVVLFMTSTGGTTVDPQVLSSVSSQINPEQTAILNEINKIRRNSGVQELIYSEQLEEITLDRVADMASRGYYSHTSPDGLTYASKLKELGVYAPNSCENLQLQTNGSISDAFSAWVDSPAHYRCLVDSRMTRLGMSYSLHANGVVSSANKKQQMYVFALIVAN
jgi:uncharacterized protein YkwD